MTSIPSPHQPTRRDVAVGLAAAAIVATSTPAAAQSDARTTITGLVFEDRSGTGTRTGSEPGLADVLVSNGREVARTDQDGRYRLPVSDGDSVFVIKPSGFMVPTDADNLPRFSYVHRPDGTPADLNLRYRGLPATGSPPASVDFGLRRQAEDPRFDVVLFTDPQPENELELDFVRDTAITRVAGTGAAFGLTTGDIMFDDLALFGRYNRMIGRIGVPWWHIGGNHDLNFEAPGASTSRETFKRVYGAPYYAFAYGKALFIMLDNVNYLGAASATQPGRGGKYEGLIGERQLAFVANLLRETPKDRLVVVAMHIPLRNDLDQSRANNTVDGDELLKLLAGRKAFSIAGHTHTTEHHYLGPDQHHHHVLTAVSGSWWSGPSDRRGIASADSRDGTPNGYHVLSIDGTDYTTRFLPSQEDAARTMRVCLESHYHGDGAAAAREYRLQQLLGSPVRAEAVGSTRVVVNVFDGGPKTRVTCTIRGREPFSLTRTRRPDPFVAQIFERYRATKKFWVKAEPSSHIWTGRLPADLPAGTHRVDVLATDEYGREHNDFMVLEVTA